MGIPRHREENLYCPTVGEGDFLLKNERKIRRFSHFYDSAHTPFLV